MDIILSLSMNTEGKNPLIKINIVHSLIDCCITCCANPPPSNFINVGEFAINVLKNLIMINDQTLHICQWGGSAALMYVSLNSTINEIQTLCNELKLEENIRTKLLKSTIDSIKENIEYHNNTQKYSTISDSKIDTYHTPRTNYNVFPK